MLGQSLEKVARSVPLLVWRLLSRRDVLGFYYHVVSDVPVPHVQQLYSYKSAAMFENDLVYLTRNFNLITYEQLVEHHSGGRRLGPKSVILTFDDGLSECYSVVRPKLLRQGIPCVFFVTTEHIGNRSMFSEHLASLCIDRVESLADAAVVDIVEALNGELDLGLPGRAELRYWLRHVAAHDRRTIARVCQLLEIDESEYLKTRRVYLTSEEIKRLAHDGFTIGAHSVSHRKLGALTDLEIEEDIAASCRAIMSLTEQSQVPYAFPFSADGVSRDLLEDLRSRHPYVGLFFNTRGIRKDRNVVLSRIWGDPPDGSGLDRSNLPKAITAACFDVAARKVQGFATSLNRRQ